MLARSRIAPCLWFDRAAEDAARFYCGIFPDSRVVATSYYGEAGHDVHRMPAGTVLTVMFELEGQTFTALNAGPAFRFNEAVSLQVFCDTQDDVDRYWAALGAGGDPAAQACGWLKDRYGLSWQVVPAILPELIASPEPGRAERVLQAIMGMRKLDIAALERA